uniref:Splicing factor 45 n=1 Tax=Eptatretus burgeri TaxID=7764 RepID=A0A8C4QKP2_EPTBU
MSLYDDITVDASGPQAEGWSKNFKMLQTQLQVKKVTLTQAKVGVNLHCSKGSTNDDPGMKRGVAEIQFDNACVIMLFCSALPVEEDPMRHSRMGGKAAIPPPIYDEGSERSRSPPILPGTFLSNMGGTVAHKIMAKYGFREGQGLGKHEQGLSTALSVEKTSKRGGKIVIGEMQEKGSCDPLKKKLPPTLILTLIFQNMVGAGEVDEDLEGETKEECEKYGKVIRCLIFELPTSNDEEAVRIFLEFERIESAIKASFYNLDKFRRLDLGANISP